MWVLPKEPKGKGLSATAMVNVYTEKLWGKQSETVFSEISSMDIILLSHGSNKIMNAQWILSIYCILDFFFKDFI